MRSLVSPVTALLAAGLAIAALLFIQLNAVPDREFSGFARLNWPNLGQCSEVLSDAESFPQLSRVVTWRSDTPNHTASCSSAVIKPDGNEIEVQYSGVSSQAGKVRLEIQNHSGELLSKVELPPQQSGVWRFHRVKLAQSDIQNGIRVLVIDEAFEQGWLSLRNRVNFYYLKDRFEPFRKVLEQAPLRLGLMFLLALLITLLFCSVFTREISALKILLLFIVGANAIHFRPDAFFHMDEWTALERFFSASWKTAFAPHNEHFIPLFMLFYYAEALLSHGQYHILLAISLVLHGANALLLTCLLNKLLPGEERFSAASVILGSFYLLSGLHAEAMQWAMVQSTTISITLTLVALLAAVNYLHSGCRRHLIWLTLCLISAPLFFGGAIIVFFQVLLIASLVQRSEAAALRPMLDVLIGSAVFVAACYLIYGNAGLKLSPPDWKSFFWYLTLGTQYGTIVRGLGLTPLLAALELSPNSVSAVGLGFAANAALLIYSLRVKTLMPRSLQFWLFGNILIILPILLTAFGRVELGAEHSLALRYHSVALIGLAFLLTPPLWHISSKLTEPESSTLFNRLCLAAAVCYLFSQLHFAAGFTYYWKNGYRLQNFLTQVAHWNESLERDDKAVPFEGTGSEYHGLYPMRFRGHPKSPSGQLSILHPDTMLEIYKGLKSR